ncbi:hypothetical protein MR798_01255, partial [bacterium]|nr:hypothetical protein [bacterium]
MKKNGKRRVWVLLVLCAVVFAVFLARLVWMQFIMADHYAEKVREAGQTSYSVTLPAARGDITDRNGTVLARDTTVYDLALCVPAPPGTDLQQTLKTLEQLNLGGKDVETQLAAFCCTAAAGELPVLQNADADTVAALYRAGLVQSGAVRLAARGVRVWQ